MVEYVMIIPQQTFATAKYMEKRISANNRDTEISVLKILGHQFLSKSKLFYIILHHIGSAILNLAKSDLKIHPFQRCHQMNIIFGEILLWEGIPGQ